MPINAILRDIRNSNAVKVADNRSLSVNVLEPDLPPLGLKNVFRYFNAELKDVNGNTNQNVDGSVTPVKFELMADQDADIHIMAIVVTIAGGNVSHNSFGSIPALPIGWDVVVEEASEITTIIDKAKTSGEVIIQSGGFFPFGDQLTSWELTNFTGQTDAHIITIPVNQIVPLGGIRLGLGTVDKLESVVNDDLTGLFQVDVRVLGYRHFAFEESKQLG